MQQSDVMQVSHLSVFSIMYSIDKCAGIPDLSKLAAVPKREGEGRQAICNAYILYVHHHKCRHHAGYMETKCTLQKEKAMGVVPSLITVGKTSPAFCCGQLLHPSKECKNCK